MRAGNLDRVIIIQRATTVISSTGVPVETWATLATLRAQLIETTTDEFVRAYGASTERLVMFRTLYIDGVTASDRISYETQAFTIKQIKEIGRRKALEFRAERIGAP
jgi:SPP1 family predicted phage head-tail adaptor